MSALLLVLVCQDLDKIVRAFDGGDFNGTVLVAVKGEVLLEQGYGFADRDGEKPMKADALWDWASVSKPFTAAAVLKLQDQGKLSLDDPLSKFYWDAPEDKADVTLRQLLNHTSGIQAGFRSEWEYDPSSRESFERMMLKLPMESTPGTKWEYSNSAYVLVAAIVERVSKRPFEEFCIEALFKPAGMKDAGFIGTAGLDRSRVPKADGGRGFGGGREKFAFAYGDTLSWGYRGCGGVVATMRDMLAWDQALRGEKVLSEKAREEYYKAGLQDYALGWFVVGRGRVEHAGGVEGVLANYVRLLDEDVVVAVVLSYEPEGDFRRLTEDLLDAVRK